MTELERPTLEEAKRCPKCGLPGDDRKTVPVKSTPGIERGTTIHLIYCVTELCRWYNTCWQVMVYKDGSIPAPRNHTGEKKHYENIDGHNEQAAALIKAIEAERVASRQSLDAQVTRGPWPR